MQVRKEGITMGALTGIGLYAAIFVAILRGIFENIVNLF